MAAPSGLPDLGFCEPLCPKDKGSRANSSGGVKLGPRPSGGKGLLAWDTPPYKACLILPSPFPISIQHLLQVPASFRTKPRVLQIP